MTVVQQLKFELLFEYACSAIVDGYYREAVSSYTASMERFYEFYFQIVALRKNVSIADFGKVWKLLSRQSERQLGAYVAAYMLAEKQAPDLLPNSMVEFRNGVIHKGIIPTKDKAVEFGQSVLDTLLPSLNRIKTNYPREVSEIVHHHLVTAREQHSDTTLASFMSYPSVIGLNRPRNDESLAEYIRMLERRRINTGW
ncbi:MAG: hypothetical protein ACFCUR_13065 [Rhodomicrobiaceae bacterium]